MSVLAVVYSLSASWVVFFMMIFGYKLTGDLSLKETLYMATGIWAFVLVVIGLMLGGIALF